MNYLFLFEIYKVNKMIDELVIKKRNYISIRSFEINRSHLTTKSKDEISTFIERFFQNIDEDPTNSLSTDFKDKIKTDTQVKIQYDRWMNIIKRYSNDFVILNDTFYADDCYYRIDVKFPSQIDLIGDKYFRLYLTSCEGNIKIDNVFYIQDINDSLSVDKLICNLFMKDISIGNLEITKENIRYKIKIKGSLYDLEAYKNQTLGLHIHTQGNISQNCSLCGIHYNPTFQFHGDVSGERHLGDLGNIKIDSSGNSNFDIYVTSFPIPNDILLQKFLGRSLVLHGSTDDLGYGKNHDSLQTGNSGKRIACGILGGLFE